jgi:hypothetical protein
MKTNCHSERNEESPHLHLPLPALSPKLKKNFVILSEVAHGTL